MRKKYHRPLTTWNSKTMAEIHKRKIEEINSESEEERNGAEPSLSDAMVQIETKYLDPSARAEREKNWKQKLTILLSETEMLEYFTNKHELWRKEAYYWNSQQKQPKLRKILINMPDGQDKVFPEYNAMQQKSISADNLEKNIKEKNMQKCQLHVIEAAAINLFVNLLEQHIPIFQKTTKLFMHSTDCKLTFLSEKIAGKQINLYPYK